MIPFKMKAWLDLSSSKRSGERIDESDIKKHRNDVFRLSQLLNPGEVIEVPPTVACDIRRFLEAANDEKTDPRQLGIRASLEEILQRLRFTYGLGQE